MSNTTPLKQCYTIYLLHNEKLAYTKEQTLNRLYKHPAPRSGCQHVAWFLVAILPVRLAHDRIEPVRYLARVAIVPDAVQFPVEVQNVRLLRRALAAQLGERGHDRPR
uniref:(northern house mosquito) hypothetical protein n=1 Tax=Culex pipiens TaxID=7175 RepID=A0A8D8CP36_CULPI